VMIDVNPTTQKLMESFLQFKKLHWNRSPVAGFKPSEIMVLFCIKKRVKPDEPGIKVSELSSHLKVTSPTITQLVNSLEESGLVERTMDKEDRRAVRVRLTDDGENVIKKAWQAFSASFSGLVDYLGEEKSNELAELLAEVFSYFNERREQSFQQL